MASPASAFKTIDDTFKAEMVTGTAGTSTYDFPVVLNNVLGTRLKLVKGYAGSAALRLAMERGEIDGFCGVTLDSMRTAGLTVGKANILLQIALKKDPRLADVPFVMDYAKREEDRQVLRLVFGWLDLERPLAAPPATPPERVRALRQGFDEGDAVIRLCWPPPRRPRSPSSRWERPRSPVSSTTSIRRRRRSPPNGSDAARNSGAWPAGYRNLHGQSGPRSARPHPLAPTMDQDKLIKTACVAG